MTNTTKTEFTLSGSAFFGLMQSVLSRGASFRFQAKGQSMSPFIRHGDIITVAKVESNAVRVGDVVVLLNPANNAAIVHRIVNIQENSILLKGDNCISADGIFSYDTILGIVTKVERGNKEVKFCLGPANKLIAITSANGSLNTVLPLLRKLKKLFFLQKHNAEA
jgi:signal peptidase I